MCVYYLMILLKETIITKGKRLFVKMNSTRLNLKNAIWVSSMF